MILKTKFIIQITVTCLIAIFISSCGSHQEKPDDAFERVKQVRMMSTDSSFVSEKVIQESMKTEPIKKNEILDEWTKYKNEMEKKIHSNENKIKEIKGLPDANDGLLRKVAVLEKTNNDLRVKMDEYKEEVKVKWEMFQASMNHNVNEIEIELNTLKTDNKK